jgi:O-antigen/teichoic acid export membrane protein
MNTSPYSSTALKRSTVHFIIGKVISALLTLTIMFWLVRLLAMDDYGSYVTLVAGAEFALAITSLGLPWVAARYLPEFRLNANGKQIARFAWQLITLVCVFSLVGALLLFMTMPWLLTLLKLGHQIEIARLYLLVLVLEGLRRNTQVCLLEPLLQQGQSQLSQVTRNLTVLLCLGMMTLQSEIHLHDVVLAELAGSFLGTVSSLRGLILHLRTHRNLLGKSEWQPKSWSRMWHTARHMYISYLVTLTYSQYVFLFLIQRFLGVETTALFGFLLNLYGQISNYLPATLLFNLIRPKLMASYMSEGGMAQLTSNANLVGKISLFVLMPIIVFVWLAGDDFLNWLSGGKFIQAGYYLGTLLLALIPLSQRQILETVAVASGHSHYCLWGSSLGILILPFTYWLLTAGQGLWSPIIAMIAGQSIFNITLIAAMWLTTTYRPDFAGLFKLVMGALIGYISGILTNIVKAGSFPLHADDFAGLLENAQDIVSRFLIHDSEMLMHGWLDLSIVATFACGFFLLASYFFKPFRLEERMLLNKLFNRNIFVW